MSAMKLLSVVGLLSAPSAVAGTINGLRGARWNAAGDDTNLADVGGDNDTPKSSGDFIDQYIAAAGTSTGDVWMKKPEAAADSSAFGTAAFSAEKGSQSALSADSSAFGTAAFSSEKGSQSVFSLDSDSRSAFHAEAGSNSASNDMDRFFDGGSRHQAMHSDSDQPQPSRPADAEVASAQEQPQDSGGGGAVVDVKLDSELQVSGTAMRRHRSRWSDNADDPTGIDGDDDKPASSGDYMDRYIAAAKDSGDGVWLKKPEAPASGRDRDIAAFNAHGDSDTDTSAFKMPRSQDIMDAQAADAGRSEAQQDSQSSGGTSVSVTLDSELQESATGYRGAFLQVGGKPSMDPAAVRADVDAQMMQDIHIHDGFGQAAAADVTQEQEINASPDMKP